MAATVTEAPAEPLAQYRSWASVLFAILGAVALIGGAVVISSTAELYGIVLLATVGLGALIYVALALLIGRGEPWAIHAIVPVCVLLIVTGLVRSAIAIGSGTITIPLELIAAVAVITRDHRPEIMPAVSEPGRRRMWLAVGGLVVSTLFPYVAEPAMRGALFVAQEDDLALAASVDCARATEPGSPIIAKAAWSWSGSRPFAPTDDGLVLRWAANVHGQTPDVGLTVVDHRTSDQATIVMGGTGESDALLDAFRHAGLQAVDFLISRSGSELRDGSVEVDLVPSSASAATGTVDLQAAYAHGDLWIVKSSLATCTW
jgi:hypothetical protein